MTLFPSFLWLSTIPLCIWTTSFLSFGCAGSLLQRVVFFSCGARAVECVGSVVVSHGLSCPAACGILVTWPGMEPGSPASEGRFSTTGPPGKSQHHIFFIHSSVCGHLGSFRILVIMNSAAIHVGVHLSFWIIIFSGYMPRSGIAGAYCNSTYTFLRNLHTVLHGGCTSLCPHQQQQKIFERGVH